jgi:hypothetical protein
MPTRVADEVRRELQRFGPAAGMAELVGAWPAAVGDTIARNAWPARLARDGTLHVATSSSAWAFELAQLEADMLERLRRAVPEVAPPRLRFAPGPLPEPSGPDPAEAGPEAPKPGPQERAAAAELTAVLEDEELRALVARAAAASLAKRV